MLCCSESLGLDTVSSPLVMTGGGSHPPSECSSVPRSCASPPRPPRVLQRLCRHWAAPGVPRVVGGRDCTAVLGLVGLAAAGFCGQEFVCMWARGMGLTPFWSCYVAELFRRQRAGFTHSWSWSGPVWPPLCKGWQRIQWSFRSGWGLLPWALNQCSTAK